MVGSPVFEDKTTLENVAVFVFIIVCFLSPPPPSSKIKKTLVPWTPLFPQKKNPQETLLMGTVLDTYI